MSFSSSDYSQQNWNSSNSQQKLFSISSTQQSSSVVEDAYQNYFCSILHEINSYKLQNITFQELKHHKIRIISKQNPLYGHMINEGYFYAQNSSSRFCGIQCRYDVVIGNFFLVIDVLNLNRDSGQKKDQTKNIGQGHFGVVRQANVQDKKIAIKRLRIYYSGKKEENIGCLTDPKDECRPKSIKRAIKQYCIYKICSMLKIGPQIILNNVYDLVCYNDTIEFQMQLCEKVNQTIKSGYETDLKRCVALLHSIKFTHNDIKKQNILYSPSLSKYVLGDFGLAQSIKQKINEKTETYFRGTQRYSSEEMRALHFSNKLGLVNLYMNDIHGLEITLSELRQQQHQCLQQFQKNSLSYQSKSQSQRNNNLQGSSGYSQNQQPEIKSSSYSNSSDHGCKNENNLSSNKDDCRFKKTQKVSESYPSSRGQNYPGSSMNQFESNLNQISQNEQEKNDSSANSQDQSMLNKKKKKKSDKINIESLSPEQIERIIQKYNFNVAVDIVNPELFTNKLFEKYYSQINYYQMKTIYQILKRQRQNTHVSKLLYIFSEANSFRVYLQVPNQQQLSELIQQTVVKVCEKQTKREIIQLVSNLVLDSLKPSNPFYSIVVSTRNIIRTFGFVSQQTQSYLKRLIKKKLNSIPLINLLKIESKQVEKIIAYIQKEKQQQWQANNKKIDNQLVQLDNHLKFMNWKALNKQLKYLLNKNVGNITENLTQLKVKNILRAFSCFINQGDYDYPILIKMLQVSQKILSYYSLSSQQSSDQLFLEKDPTSQIFKYFKLKLFDNILKITLLRFEKNGKESFFAIFNNYKNLQASIYPSYYALPKLWSKFFNVERAFLSSVSVNQRDIQNTDNFTQFIEHLYIILEAETILSSDYIKCYQLIDKYQNMIRNSMNQTNCYYKAKILKVFVRLTIQKSDFRKAYELNELYFQLMQKIYFPKYNTDEFFNYYTQKAQILYKERKFYEALQNYNKSLDILLQTFRQNGEKNDLIGLMNNISCCYDELEDYQNEEKFNQQILQIAEAWKSCKVVTKIYLLDNIIRCRLRLRKTDGIKERFERLVQWKLELLKEFQNNDPEFVNCGRQLQAFIFLTNQNLPLSTDSIMVYAKKALLSVLEDKIPTFIITYRMCIQDIAYYYTAKQMNSKALPYLSLYFIRFPLTGINEQQFYLKVDFYAAMLINAQSNRRAYQFLKKFIYKVPKELVKMRSQLFKKLYLLSRQIGEKNSTLYGLIYKNKAFQNEENCSACLEIVKKMDIQFLSVIYAKIMKLVSFSLSNPIYIDVKKQMLENRVLQKHKQKSCQDINFHKEKIKQHIEKNTQQTQVGYYTEKQLKKIVQKNRNGRLRNRGG